MSIKLDTEFDYSGYNQVMKDIQRLVEREVAVGFDDSDHSDKDELTMAELAIIHENGTRGRDGGYHIPPRKFVTRAGYNLAEVINAESEAVVINSLKGKHSLVNKHLDAIGEKGIQATQEAIDRQGYRKLSPTTIRIKRHKNSRYPTEQLLDSEALYEGVMYKIK